MSHSIVWLGEWKLKIQRKWQSVKGKGEREMGEEREGEREREMRREPGGGREGGKSIIKPGCLGDSAKEEVSPSRDSP